MFITESNLSWGQTQPMTEIFGALWLADNAGAFLAAGGNVFYHSPIQPEPLRSGCRGWGTYGNFVTDATFQIKGHTSQYFASQLINLEWVEQGGKIHKIFAASSDLRDGAAHVLVTAYALLRPDGQWSLMLVNKDQSNAHAVRIVFDASGATQQGYFSGPVHMITFGSEQYVWHSEGPNSHADPDNPPVTTSMLCKHRKLYLRCPQLLSRCCGEKWPDSRNDVPNPAQETRMRSSLSCPVNSNPGADAAFAWLSGSLVKGALIVGLAIVKAVSLAPATSAQTVRVDARPSHACATCSASARAR